MCARRHIIAINGRRRLGKWLEMAANTAFLVLPGRHAPRDSSYPLDTRYPEASPAGSCSLLVPFIVNAPPPPPPLLLKGVGGGCTFVASVMNASSYSNPVAKQFIWSTRQLDDSAGYFVNQPVPFTWSTGHQVGSLTSLPTASRPVVTRTVQVLILGFYC